MADLKECLDAIEADIERISATVAVLWFVKFGEWPKDERGTG